MSEELKSLITGLITGLFLVGSLGLLIGNSAVPGVVLLVLASVSLVIAKGIWSNHE